MATTTDITDPTGGAPNFDIQAVFESFGYTPSQAEINSLAPAFEGAINVGETGFSAVANYVQAHQQVAGAQSLIQGNLTAETQAASDATKAGNASFDAAQSTLESAPKLFGSMTPDQITQYLAPLQNQFNYGLGQVQGAAGQRGLSGSSLEAQAMAQAQQQFQQQVLSQGLSVGMSQQQLLAQQQQSRGQTQLGLAPQFLGLANQSAGQNYGAATDLAGLPGQSVAQSLAIQQLLQQMMPKDSSPLGGFLGTGLGFLAGGPIGANIGGNIASAVTGNPTGANLGSAVNPLSSTFGLNQTGQYQNPFANAGVMSLLRNFGGSSGSGAAGAGAGASGAGATSGLNSLMMAA